MDQKNIDRQPRSAETQAHDKGLPGLLAYLIANRATDRRGFWLSLLVGIALLLAAVYGFPHLIGLLDAA